MHAVCVGIGCGPASQGRLGSFHASSEASPQDFLCVMCAQSPPQAREAHHNGCMSQPCCVQGSATHLCGQQSGVVSAYCLFPAMLQELCY